MNKYVVSIVLTFDDFRIMMSESNSKKLIVKVKGSYYKSLNNWL